MLLSSTADTNDIIITTIINIFKLFFGGLQDEKGKNISHKVGGGGLVRDIFNPEVFDRWNSVLEVQHHSYSYQTIEAGHPKPQPALDGRVGLHIAFQMLAFLNATRNVQA